MRSNVNYSNGYRRLPIKIPETISEIVSGHLFESDFKPYFIMFLNDPLGLTLVDRYNCFRQNQKLIVLWVRLPQACPDHMLLIVSQLIGEPKKDI